LPSFVVSARMPPESRRISDVQFGFYFFGFYFGFYFDVQSHD
jgi:hypothetical protein